MTTVHAYAATEQDGQFAPVEYEPGELDAHEVDMGFGDRVGLGWHGGYGMPREKCASGDHNMCGH